MLRRRDLFALLLVAVLEPFVMTENSIFFPKVDETKYVVDGDVMLGIATVLTRFDDKTPCGVTVTRTGLTYMQTQLYAMRKINADPTILKNISLGVIATDTCGKDLMAIARSLQLLPNSAFKCDKHACPKNTSDIVGVLGDVFNPTTQILAKIFQLFEIPQVSPFATSNQLSNKKEYPYFLRVLPPTRYEIQSILEFIRYFNWTYVSAIFTDDDTGRDGDDNLKEFAEIYGICVAYTTLVRRRPTPAELEAVTLKLTHKSKARVVLLLGDYRTNSGILSWARDSGRLNYFIWFISRGYTPREEYFESVAGSFVADVDIKQSEEFNAAYLNYTGRHPDFANLPAVWFKEFIKDSFPCTWDVQDNKTADCEDYLDTPFSAMESQVTPRNLFSKAIDAVYLFAHGLDRLIKENCDDARVHKEKLKACVNGPLLFQYMKNASFEGVGGQISLNEDGDSIGEFFISQYQLDNPKELRRVKIGKYQMDKSLLEVNTSRVLWYKDGKPTDLDTPISICAFECGPNEFRIQLEQKCCWECKECHPEERIVKNGTECEVCPLYSWPNQVHFRTCDPIDPVYLEWADVVGLSLTILAAVGTSTTLFVIVLYFHNRTERLIKASSRELSMVMAVGLLLSYLAVFPIIAKPSVGVCWVQRLGFSISYAIVYAPMLLKSSRIYRIFSAGNSGNTRPKFVSTRAQIVFTAIAIAIQVVTSLLTAFFWQPTPKLQMPVRTEPFVELLCSLPVNALAIPLSYNILLVAISAFHGWKTRKLPENFNESRYIFLSVCTTLFLWLAFLPTYFSAFYARQKAMLLALSLIINSSVILLCLFFPKLYSVYYVDETQMNIGPYTNNSMAHSNSRWASNRIHPTLSSVTNDVSSIAKTSTSTRPSVIVSSG